MNNLSVSKSVLDLKVRIKTIQKTLESGELGFEQRIIEKIIKKLETKRRLYLSQRGKCCFCGEMTFASYGFSKAKLATIEHVLPRSKGEG